MPAADLSSLLAGMAGRRVLVVGDAVLDVYVRGTSTGLSREAPVPVVAVDSVEEAPGAAGNVAANLAALGGEVTLLSLYGADPAGKRLRALLGGLGIATHDLARVPSGPAVVKRRVVADGQVLLRLDEGSPADGLPPNRGVRSDRLVELAEAVDAVVVCDYGYGVIGPLTGALAMVRPRVPIMTLDARRPGSHRELRPTLVKPNYAETVQALQLTPARTGRDRFGQVLDHGDELLVLTGAELVAVTLDADGSVLFERGRAPFQSHGARLSGTVVGAGDAFLATATLALAAGAAPPAAIELATVAAGVAGVAAGTAVCRRDELAGRLGSTAKLLPADAAAGWAATVHAHDRRIVLTNGCFDLLHEGHIVLLSQAKALGDVLVVGVNDDASVRRIKGVARPVVDLAGRMRVLAALTCVDQVVAFAEDTASALIERIRPDVYVKGGDYSMADLPEAGTLRELGAAVHFLGHLPERSTSRIIERILSGL